MITGSFIRVSHMGTGVKALGPCPVAFLAHYDQKWISWVVNRLPYNMPVSQTRA